MGHNAQRAVRTALSIVKAMANQDARFQHEKGIALAVRVGIHTGLIVVGEMGEVADRNN